MRTPEDRSSAGRLSLNKGAKPKSNTASKGSRLKNLGMTTFEKTSGFLTTNVSPLVVQHARSGSSASQAQIILNVLRRNTGSWPLMSSALRRGWARMVYSPHVGICLAVVSFPCSLERAIRRAKCGGALSSPLPLPLLLFSLAATSRILGGVLLGGFMFFCAETRVFSRRRREGGDFCCQMLVHLGSIAPVAFFTAR